MIRLRHVLAFVVLLAGLEPAVGQDKVVRPRGPESGQHVGSFTARPYDGRRIDFDQHSQVRQGRAFGHDRTAQYNSNTSQGRSRDVIPPSVALRVALSYSPGSQGLGVNLVRGQRLVYAVKLKTGNRVHRVLVDARTGQVVGD